MMATPSNIADGLLHLPSDQNVKAASPHAAAPSYATLLSLQELVSRVAAQVLAAHGEIGETRAILQDAIQRLIPAFTKPVNANASVNIEACEVNKTKEAAFNALQFQDISDQLLAHAQCRLNALIRELDDLAATVAPTAVLQRAAGPSGENSALSHHLIGQVERINDNLAELDLSLSKPVSKAHLGIGEMEFF